MRTKEYVNEKETNEYIYTTQEIDRIVDENEDKIFEYCEQVEIEHARWGIYNQYDTLRVLFDLKDEGLHLQVCGHGLTLEIFEGIKEGYIIEVYKFESGRLYVDVEEGFAEDDDVDDKAKKLYERYENVEITEEEYNYKYYLIEEAYKEMYYENVLNTRISIDIRYPDEYNYEEY